MAAAHSRQVAHLLEQSEAQAAALAHWKSAAAASPTEAARQLVLDRETWHTEKDALEAALAEVGGVALMSLTSLMIHRLGRILLQGARWLHLMVLHG